MMIEIFKEKYVYRGSFINIPGIYISNFNIAEIINDGIKYNSDCSFIFRIKDANNIMKSNEGVYKIRYGRWKGTLYFWTIHKNEFLILRRGLIVFDFLDTPEIKKRALEKYKTRSLIL